NSRYQTSMEPRPTQSPSVIIAAAISLSLMVVPLGPTALSAQVALAGRRTRMSRLTGLKSETRRAAASYSRTSSSQALPSRTTMSTTTGTVLILERAPDALGSTVAVTDTTRESPSWLIRTAHMAQRSLTTP